MRILIIGGTRFIGPPVAERLHALGHSLWLFHRHPAPDTALLPDAAQHVYGDRHHLDDYGETFRHLNLDIVLDMIPITENDARAVMRVFKGIAQRVVTISSQDVYRAYGRVNGTEPGPADPIPLAEDSPLRERLYPYRSETPRSPDDPRRVLDDYDKILVERAVMSDPALPGTVLRLPMVYGPGDYQHRLFPYLKRMDDRRPAIVMNEQTARWRWTRAYVENIAAAIALAVTDFRALGRVYNLGESVALSTADWIRAIADVAGWNGQIIAAPDYQLPEEMKSRAGLDQHLVTDTTRIQIDLGFEPPVSYREGLRRTIAWERAHPPDPLDQSQFDYATEDAIITRLMS